ncbi:MAG: S8 family serine peptidase [Actinomycetota bacterium]
MRRVLVGLTLGLLVASLLPAATAQAAQGRYIVVLKDSVSSPGSVASEHARDHGAEVSHVYRFALKGYAAAMSSTAVERVRADDRVAYVSEDGVVQAVDHPANAPTGVHRVFAPDNAEIDIDGVDDFRVDADIAIIDTGIDLDHPDLNVVGGKNCSTGNSFDDGNGHGTHVAGTAAGKDNGSGAVGMAPGARLWAARVLNNAGSGSWSSVICGVDWVTGHGGIEVANMSLGGSGSDSGCSGDALHNAICNSVAAGTTYAVAAGNESDDAANHVPAAYDEVITVSALADFDGEPGGLGSPTCRSDMDDTFANFSNFGDDVDIIAPGVCIFSTWKGGGYNTISGTSMASPHVAGAAALYKATNPSATPSQVQTAVVGAGNTGWNNLDDGDLIKENLLDVSSATVFNPALLATDTGGGGETNSAPVANNDSATTEIDTAIAVDVLANDSDADGDPLTVTNLTQPSNGAVVLNPDGTVTYTPNAGFVGSDSFTYTANDGTTDSNVATVSITVQDSTTDDPDPWDLTVIGTKLRGTKSADLTWTTGATSAGSVDVYRDGAKVTTTDNDGAHTDVIGKGGGSHTYQVCEANSTTNCSAEVTVNYN